MKTLPDSSLYARLGSVVVDGALVLALWSVVLVPLALGIHALYPATSALSATALALLAAVVASIGWSVWAVSPYLGIRRGRFGLPMVSLQVSSDRFTMVALAVALPLAALLVVPVHYYQVVARKVWGVEDATPAA